MSLGDKLKRLFGMNKPSDETWEDLLDLLVESDISPSYAYQLSEKLQAHCRRSGLTDQAAIRQALADLMAPDLSAASLSLPPQRFSLVMLLGVNGVGKTTTAAKLAHYARQSAGLQNILLAAGDTFRAAAIDQLRSHGQRLGIRVIAQEQGSDAGAVLYDALEAAKASRCELLIADTAGRMHNKQNLVRELEKMNKIIAGQTADSGIAEYRKLLVLDATTGSNALRQAESFMEAVQVDGIIMTKLDSSAKGGMLASIGRQLGLPAYFVCSGETYDDMQVFDPQRYLHDLLGL